MSILITAAQSTLSKNIDVIQITTVNTAKFLLIHILLDARDDEIFIQKIIKIKSRIEKYYVALLLVYFKRIIDEKYLIQFVSTILNEC